MCMLNVQYVPIDKCLYMFANGYVKLAINSSIDTVNAYLLCRFLSVLCVQQIPMYLIDSYVCDCIHTYR